MFASSRKTNSRISVLVSTWFTFFILSCTFVAAINSVDRANVRGTAIWRRRSLSAQDPGGDTSFDLFENLNGGGNDQSNEDSFPDCVRPDQYGDFYSEPTYTDAALVAWTYQIQGALEMTVSNVHKYVVPEIEKQLSAKLMSVLLNTTVCDESDDPLIASQMSVGGTRGRRHLLQFQPLVLSNQAEVTGLLQQPKDTILKGHDGVLCESPEFIPGAVRCFKLIGGITITGRNGDIDEAVALAQEAIRTIMNDQNFLDKAHSNLMNVQYLAPEPDYHVYFGGGDPKPSEPVDVPGRPNNAGDDNDGGSPARDWPVWPFLVMGGSVVLGAVIVFMMWRRKQGSFGQIRNKHSRRLLSLSPSSDDSGISSKSSSEKEEHQFNMLSNTWRNMGPPTEIEKSEVNKTEYSSDDAATTDRSTSSASHFFDEGKSTDSQSPSFIVSGTFAETEDSALDMDGPLLGSGSDKASYDTSILASDHASSNFSADNDESTDDDTSDGSSTQSDDPPRQPPRRLRRSVL